MSADGSTIVLVEAEDAKAKAKTSRFAIVARTLDAKPRIVELAGAFEYDALSPDGSLLYVVEHLPGPPAGHYQVRTVETATGTLRPEVVVDKTEVNEEMAGWPVAQARRSDGLVLTLYRGEEHPFIHALNSIDAWAICLDLPATGADDADAALDWGLAAKLDGRPARDQRDARAGGRGRPVRLRGQALRPVRALCRSRHRAGQVRPPACGAGGATGRGRVRWIRVLRGRTRWDRPDRSEDARSDISALLEGSAVESMAVMPDGTTIYALLAAGGRIVKVDATTGEVLGQVPSSGFDRLVAIVPY